MIFFKKCTVCKNNFPASHEYFHKKITGKYGLVAKCRTCAKIYNKNMYKKHRAKRIEQKREYRKKNRNKIIISSKKSYKKHREKRLLEKRMELKLNPNKLKEIRRKQYIKHREKRLKYVKEYALKNKEKIRKKQAQYTIERYHKDAEFKIKMNVSRRIRSLINKNGTKTIDLIGCSINHLKNHLESKFTLGMNWENHGRNGWHIDHILPCASFDLTDYEQQKKCFHYTNLQPLWEKDNIKKGDKVLYNIQ